MRALACVLILAAVAMAQTQTAASSACVSPPPNCGRNCPPVKLRILRYVAPVCKICKVARIEGAVVVAGMIDEAGKFKEVKVISGHPILVQATIDAVRQWIVQPYCADGKHAQTTRVQVTVPWKVPGPGPEPAVVVAAATAAPPCAPMPHGPNVLLKLVKYLPPAAPPGARIAETTLVFSAQVDEYGKLHDLVVNNGHPILTKLVMDAAAQWQTQTYCPQGKPFGAPASIVISWKNGWQPPVVSVERIAQ